MNEKQLQAKAERESTYLIDKTYIKVNMAASANHETANACYNLLTDWAKNTGGKVKITRTGSLGYGDLEPIMMIQKPGKAFMLYAQITEDVTQELIRNALEGDNERFDLALHMETPLFLLQKRIALRNCGFVDPQKLSDYIVGYQGYVGLAKALDLNPTDLIEEIRHSGLRNRMGSGGCTAAKWKTVQEAQAPEKIVIVSAMDCSPGSSNTRLLLEGAPHSVLEGILIACYAVGANQALIAIPENWSGVKEKLEKATAQMKEYELVGKNILNSEFCCEIGIRKIKWTMTAGEETSLLRVLEGRQAIPYWCKDQEGLLQLGDKPALVTDIETLANVSAILQRGAKWFAGIGTSESKGTKIISLSGSILHPYTVEVPYGTTLQSLVEEIGGGAPSAKAIKAVQLGWPTSAFYVDADFYKPLDQEMEKESGSLRGVGILDVIDEDACAVENAERLMRLIHDQSCGKCVYCREGTLHMSQILRNIAQGQGTARDLELLWELGQKMEVNTICSFGKSAANPVLSGMRLFSSDYDAHIKQHKCSLSQHGEEA